MLPSRSEFKNLKRLDAELLTDVQRAARFIYMDRLCFAGKTFNPVFAATPTRTAKFNTEKIVEEFQLSAKRLANATLENLMRMTL